MVKADLSFEKPVTWTCPQRGLAYLIMDRTIPIPPDLKRELGE